MFEQLSIAQNDLTQRKSRLEAVTNNSFPLQSGRSCMQFLTYSLTNDNDNRLGQPLGTIQRHHEHRQNSSLKYFRFCSYKAAGFCQTQWGKLQTPFLFCLPSKETHGSMEACHTVSWTSVAAWRIQTHRSKAVLLLMRRQQGFLWTKHRASKCKLYCPRINMSPAQLSRFLSVVRTSVINY